MSKRYTAQEMRIRADYEESANANAKTASMLRQAADDMEREEKRKRMYEFSVKEFGGYVQPLHEDSVHSSFLDGRVMGDENYVVVRREVGDWEEVSE